LHLTLSSNGLQMVLDEVTGDKLCSVGSTPIGVALSDEVPGILHIGAIVSTNGSQKL